MNESPIGLAYSGLASRDRFAVTWAFFWRGAIASVLGGVLGAILGYVLVWLWQLLRMLFGIALPADMVMPIARGIGGAGGIVAALLCTWLYVHWLFSSRLGGYRLTLQRVAE